MSHELFWLVMTTAMTGLMWVPYILDRMMVRGMMGALANPSPADKPQSPWAQRLMAAHVNAVENLIIFAPLVLAAQDLNVNLATPTTTFACDYQVIEGHWLVTHATYSHTFYGPLRMGRVTATAEATNHDFAFPAAPSDPKLAG